MSQRREPAACLKLAVMIFVGMISGSVCHKVTIVPIRQDISAPLLTCWTCSHSSDSPNNDCIEMNNIENMTRTECQIYEPFCKVQRFEADGKVEKFERSCTQECKPICHRYESVLRCDSCCTQPLCNVGNNTDIRAPDFMTILIGLLACVWLLACN